VSQPRLRLFPADEPLPRSSRMPTGRALRWSSPLEDGAKAAVTVFVTQGAFVRVCAHAGSDLTNEVGGVLAGRWRVDRSTGESFVVVEGVLPAAHTRQGRTYVTFTQDSLVDLNSELERRYPGKLMVGWYHTHPRMDVFLSGYDVWLHEHFFPELWHVALVIEPHKTSGGFFIRMPDGHLDPHRYFGFFELTDSGRSVVHWRNLTPEGGREEAAE